jgi:hypothetical protein
MDGAIGSGLRPDGRCRNTRQSSRDEGHRKRPKPPGPARRSSSVVSATEASGRFDGIETANATGDVVTLRNNPVSFGAVRA